jgi:SAM-dependent methyltransferase
MSSIAHRATRVAQVIRQRHAAPISNLLVVGCGNGREAQALAKALRCNVVGIDLRARFDPAAAAAVRLERADATDMPFESGYFDFVYSYHVLEHIPNYRAALAEMDRVLAPGGGVWIGTPNRARLLGYLGSEASLKQAIKWNAADWNARLKGRFRNEFGAHAGFTLQELGGELRSVFSQIENATLDYYLAIYPHRARTVRMLESSGLGKFAFPSIYFVGGKDVAASWHPALAELTAWKSNSYNAPERRSFAGRSVAADP